MTQSGCILQGPSLRLCKSQSLRLKILEKFVLQNSSTRKSKRAEAKRVKARKRIIVLAASVRRIWVFDSFIANSYSNNPFTLWTRNCRPARAVGSGLSLWHRLYAVSCFSRPYLGSPVPIGMKLKKQCYKMSISRSHWWREKSKQQIKTACAQIASSESNAVLILGMVSNANWLSWAAFIQWNWNRSDLSISRQSMAEENRKLNTVYFIFVLSAAIPFERNGTTFRFVLSRSLSWPFSFVLSRPFSRLLSQYKCQCIEYRTRYWLC